MWQNIRKTTRAQEIQFIFPVFPNAALDLNHAYLKQLAEQLRETPQTAAPSATQDDAEAAAIRELERRRQFGDALQSWWRKY